VELKLHPYISKNMKLYLKLLKFLRPHFKYLFSAILFMILYAGISGFTLTMIVPFTKVIFYPEEEVVASSPIVKEKTSSPEKSKSLLVLLPGKIKEKADFLLKGNNKVETLKRLCIFILFIFFLKNIFWYLQSFLVVKAEQGVIMDIRNKLYSHYHLLPLEYFYGKKTGVLISRITNDVNLVRGAVGEGFAQLLRQSFLVIVYLFMVFWASWKLALIALLLLPPSIILISKLGQKLRKKSTLTQEKMGNITSVLQETVSGIRVVKAFAMEKFEITKFINSTKDYFKTMVKLIRISSLGIPLTEYLGVIMGVLILWFGGKSILSGGSLTPDRFLLFLLAMFSLIQPIKMLSGINVELQQGLAAAKRIFEVLDTEPKIKSPENPIKIDGFRSKVEFKEVCFSYIKGKEVLHNINLEVNSGEIVALVGPSGAGKSTLVDLLPRFYDPTSGEIIIDGIDLKMMDLEWLRSIMGIVTQETILFNDTVWNNIAYGHNNASKEQVYEAAMAANAHQFIQQMSEGYQTLIGDRGVKLSGGERQRLAIARAIFKNPQILIFDEATSALDSESEILVQQAIDRMMKGRTTLVIAHRLSTVQHAHKIVVMDKGRIVQIGDHKSLIEEEGLYKRLYEMQFKL
jgi:subfamily B ATP-binding cassette protein MsbA